MWPQSNWTLLIRLITEKVRLRIDRSIGVDLVDRIATGQGRGGGECSRAAVVLL